MNRRATKLIWFVIVSFLLATYSCEKEKPIEQVSGSITSLNCNPTIHNGALSEGILANGVSSNVPYSGGNGGTHNGQTVNSTGVTGLTATLLAGTFANGSDSLTYTISGTPASSGTASFALSIGGQNCILSRSVDPIAQGCNGATSFTDPRDGQTYAVVQIGNQCWMVENLNYEVGNSWCYGNSSGNCNTYGRLYDWSTALIACPSGWHLPSDAEWSELVNFLGGSGVAGGKMKITTGWNAPNTGATNSSGFSGLPGGFRFYSGTFYGIGDYGYWWSSTEFNTSYSWYRGLSYVNGNVFRTKYYKSVGLSCRCLRD